MIKEELKSKSETRLTINDPDLPIAIGSVDVPLFKEILCFCLRKLELSYAFKRWLQSDTNFNQEKLLQILSAFERKVQTDIFRITAEVTPYLITYIDECIELCQKENMSSAEYQRVSEKLKEHAAFDEEIKSINAEIKSLEKHRTEQYSELLRKLSEKELSAADFYNEEQKLKPDHTCKKLDLEIKLFEKQKQFNKKQKQEKEAILKRLEDIKNNGKVLSYEAVKEKLESMTLLGAEQQDKLVKMNELKKELMQELIDKLMKDKVEDISDSTLLQMANFIGGPSRLVELLNIVTTKHESPYIQNLLLKAKQIALALSKEEQHQELLEYINTMPAKDLKEFCARSDLSYELMLHILDKALLIPQSDDNIPLILPILIELNNRMPNGEVPSKLYKACRNERLLIDFTLHLSTTTEQLSTTTEYDKDGKNLCFSYDNAVSSSSAAEQSSSGGAIDQPAPLQNNQRCNHM